MNQTSSSGKPVVLITGASSGIGQACAIHLHRRSYRVFGTSRQARPDNGSFTMIPMDVDDEASVRRGIDQIIRQTGRLDVTVNNAGIVFAGAIEDTSIEEAKAQFETNLFGVMCACWPTCCEHCRALDELIGAACVIPQRGLEPAILSSV